MKDLFTFADAVAPAPRAPDGAGAPSEDAVLDAQQAAAAAAPEPRIVVRAGAGTGKTRTLVARIVFLIEKRGLPPENIVAVTFTNKAASEIRARVGARIGEAVARRLVLGTFHSISSRILRRNADRVGLSRKYSIVDDGDIRRLVNDAVAASRVLPRHHDDNDDDYAACLAAYGERVATRIRLWKAWGLTEAVIEDPDRPRRSPEEEAGARVYMSYQDDLRRRNLADFSDLLLKVVDLLSRDGEALAAESGLVRHLLVDEAQDANPVQVRWTQLLSSVHGEVTSIGDEDQSIFSFQAGYPGAISDIAGPAARVYPVTANRRCTQEILAPAVQLVGWNRRSAGKVLESARRGDKPKLALYGNEKEEATALATELKARLADGLPPDDVAVLVRSTWAMKPIEEALIKASIPYQLVGGMAFSDQEEIKDVAAYFKLAINPFDDLAFRRVVNKPVRGLGPAAEHAILNFRSGDSLPLYEVCQVLRSRSGLIHDAGWREGLAKISSVLMTLASAAANARCTASELVEIVLHDNGAGYETFAQRGRDKKAARRRSENLLALQRIAEEEPEPALFLERVLLSTDKVGKMEPGKVRLSTMHSSKGLEWRHVCLPAFSSDVIPAPRAVATPSVGTAGDPWEGPVGGGMEEERRLAHVAMTRAKDTLSFSASLSRDGRRCHASVFLPESGLEEILSFDAFDAGLGKAKGALKGVRAGRKGFAKRKN